MVRRMTDSSPLQPDLRRVLSALQESLAELEVWRQNARTPDEFSALRRMAASLADAKRELEEKLRGIPQPTDARQQSLLPPR